MADFDGDQYLGKEDLEQVINAITRDTLTDDEVSYICDKVYFCLHALQSLIVLQQSELLACFIKSLWSSQLHVVTSAEGGDVFTSVRLSVRRITEKVVNGF